MNSKYKLKISGYNSKRFVLDLISKKISLYHIEYHPKYSIIIVNDDGYEYIKNKKTIYKIEKIRSYGFSHIKDIVKKYSYFIISLIIGITILELLSNIVFSIKVEHPKSEIRNLLLYDLDEFGLRKYHFKISSREKEKIKRKILQKEKDKIEWIEIENIGTNYIIKVEERIKNKIKKKKILQHIVAKKDAMILDIDADHGEVVKKTYDYVKKGDVIISGIIKNKDKYMTKVHATGKVYGEVWYKVSVELPINYKSIKLTNDKKNKIEVKLFNKSLFILPNKYNTYKIERYPLIENKIIPFSINYSKVTKTKEINRKYNFNNIESDAIKKGGEKLKEKLGKNDTIIYKKVLKKYQKDSKIVVDIFFKTKENITDTESIEDIDLEKYEEGGINGTND